MSNNVTRKGLAFGALVALVSSAIAGAPAQAAGELNVVPSAGTSYNALSGTVFNLKTTLAPGFTPSSYDQLRYQIKTDANSAINYGTGVAAVAAPATSVAVSTTAVSPATTGVYSATTVNYLGLSAATTSVTSSVEVTAFIDANNDGALSAGEWNTVRTVTFKKAADVTPTVTVAQAATGDTSAKVTVNWGDLNVEQINRSGAYGVANGSTNSSLGLEIKTTQNSTYVAAAFASGEFTRGSLTALVAGDVVTAQAVYATNTFASSTNTYSSVALGTAGTSTATARTINATGTGLVANVIKGNDAQATAATTLSTATVATVRTNGSFTAQVVAKDAATTPAVVAGVAVTGRVSTTETLRAASTGVTEISITVNGTKYTDRTTLGNATFALTTDASGVASLNISSTGLTAGTGRITPTFSAQNLTAGVVVTLADAAFTITEASTAGGYVTTPGTSTTLNYSVKDQFGVAISGGTYRIKAVVSGGGRGSAADLYSAPIAGGSATVTVTDSQTTSPANASVVASLELQNSSTLNWASATATGVTTAINYSTTALGFTTAPAINATTGINNGPWTTSGDQKQTISQVVLTDTAATGYVAPAASPTWAQVDFTAVHQYSAVTVSGTGVYLALASGTPAADKLSFTATGSSQSVFVASNTVGTKTITFVIGSSTKTVDVKFASAAVNTNTSSAVATSVQATAANFAVAVAAAAQAGRSIDATVTVTDKWGNPVAGFAATASVAGVASVNGGFSANVTTDANGKATVKLTAGINDLGDAVVTFSDNDVNTSTNVTAVAKTVVFGQTDGYIDILNEKRASVTWSMAKGKRVAFYLNGVRKYNFVQTGDAELNLQFNLKKGTHNIKLVIGGQIVDDITVKITK